MARAASSPPALSIGDDYRKEEENKCAYLVVALCPCLVCFMLLRIALSIILVVKFHFFCHTPLHSLLLNNGRTFSSDADSGLEEDYDGRGVSGESCVDLDEVHRVCKVIDELFALDRNMEAVLDECGEET
ncbi:hypothetical protein V8G54_003856 [Vigna mungo]|uniref:Uncharacterized protein n=1 Tax=Vigna mungo TaxID=3915 RepID=A0AAQ3PEB2_VIGMU